MTEKVETYVELHRGVGYFKATRNQLRYRNKDSVTRDDGRRDERDATGFVGRAVPTEFNVVVETLARVCESEEEHDAPTSPCDLSRMRPHKKIPLPLK